MLKGFIFYVMSTVAAVFFSTNTIAAEPGSIPNDPYLQEIRLLKQQLNLLNEKVAVLETYNDPNNLDHKMFKI